MPVVSRVPIELLQGIEPQKRVLLGTQPLRRRPAREQCDALGRARDGQVLPGQGGARCLRDAAPGSLALIEIHREDIAGLPVLLDRLRGQARRCLIFCDDLSFERQDADYKALKSVLDGGIEGRPENVLFYATSNRRHLMPREMIENERSTAISPAEATEEKVSLSDRFGLWIGFHGCDQETISGWWTAMPRISA